MCLGHLAPWHCETARWQRARTRPPQPCRLGRGAGVEQGRAGPRYCTPSEESREAPPHRRRRGARVHFTLAPALRRAKLADGASRGGTQAPMAEAEGMTVAGCWPSPKAEHGACAVRRSGRSPVAKRSPPQGHSGTPPRTVVG